MISPSLGGFLYDTFGYESIFTAVFVLIAIDVVLRLVVVEKKVAATFQEPLVPESCSNPCGRIQTTNAAEPSSSETSALLNTATTSTLPPFEVPALESLSLATVGQITTHPLLTLLKSPRILASLYGAVVTATVLVAFDAVLPIFVAQQFGWGATGGGLVFLSITVTVSAAPLAGQLADRYRSGLLTALWFALSGLLTALLSFATSQDLTPLTQQLVLCLLLTLYGMWPYKYSSTLRVSRMLMAGQDLSERSALLL